MVTVKDLPDEIVIEIFGFLSPKTLKNCNLVCKRWDEIISNSSALMNNYMLRLRIDEEVPDVNRKIQTIFLQDVKKLDVSCQFDLHTFIADTKSIFEPKLKQSDLVQALKSLKSLKVLDIQHIENCIDEVITKDFQKVQLNLEELTVTLQMLHIFECNTLKRFELCWETSLNFERRTSALKFLNQQKNLKDFNLDDGKDFDESDDNSDFFGTLRSQPFIPKFRLEKFILSDSSYPFDRHEELITFLNYQKSTLKMLILKLNPNMDSIMRIQRHVLENFSSLTNLSMNFQIAFETGIDIFSLTDDEPRNATNVTNNLQYFRYNLLNRSLDENKRFIDMFGNLKHLHLHEMSFKNFDLLKHLSATKNQLESLSLTNHFVFFSNDLDMATIIFPNLKNFAIHCDKSLKNFHSFIMNHEKTLEKISIEIDDSSKLTIDALAKCPKLKFIELNGLDCIISYDEYEIFSSPTIEAIKMLPSENHQLIIKISSWKATKTFKFPEDKIFWDEFFASLKPACCYCLE